MLATRPDSLGSYSGVPGTSPASCSRVFLLVSGIRREPGALVGGGCAAGAEGPDEDLGDDGADFAGGGGDTVGG
jgi:hypothetical protein